MQVMNVQRRFGASAAGPRRGPAPRGAAPLPRASSNGAAAPATAVDEYAAAWTAAAAKEGGAPAPVSPDGTETFLTTNRDAYFTRRHELVLRHFPNALGVDDFISRVEIALSAHGFRGDNSIGALERGG
jgi:hypothetical protein